MVTECEFRAVCKGAALFTIGKFDSKMLDIHIILLFLIFYFPGFSFPYIALSAYVKKSNPRAFRYLLVIPVMTSLHMLTYIPKDLEKCRQQQMEQELKK